MLSAKASSRTTAVPHPRSSAPVAANFAAHHLTIGCGVAIFHVASQRVVVCYHSRDRYWFLPKGRRDAGEETARTAEREGFEESGYRNRLIPIPIVHRQPLAHAPSTTTATATATAAAAAPSPFSTEPVWTQLIPLSTHTQYILFWYIAETLPPDAEAALRQAQAQIATQTQTSDADSDTDSTVSPYVLPPPYPADLPLSERVRMEGQGYVPPRHENTGVDEEEALYESHLLPVEEALGKLRGSIMADVVRKGWQGIRDRLALEAAC